MSRPRCLPLPHPLAPLFDRAVDSLTAALTLSTTGHYRSTVRNFLRYLGTHHPQVCHCLGLSTRIVPHQLRYTFATEMLRAGVSSPL